MYELFLIILGAYLLGSIPSSVMMGKLFFDVDIRTCGSGNAGTTNTFRVLGKKAAIPVLLIDIIKGFIAIKLVYLTSFPESYPSYITLFQIGLTIAALLGHLFPVFAQFKGGKGIAVLFGAIVAIYWPFALGICIVFVLLLALFGYVSLAAISAAISLPVITLIFNPFEHLYFLYFTLWLALVILITHRKNIKRLLKGEEGKIFKEAKKNTNRKDNMV